MWRLVVALAFQREDGVSVFFQEIPGRSIGHHEAID